jgi:hypothetical protein
MPKVLLPNAQQLSMAQVPGRDVQIPYAHVFAATMKGADAKIGQATRLLADFERDGRALIAKYGENSKPVQEYLQLLDPDGKIGGGKLEKVIEYYAKRNEDMGNALSEYNKGAAAQMQCATKNMQKLQDAQAEIANAIASEALAAYLEFAAYQASKYTSNDAPQSAAGALFEMIDAQSYHMRGEMLGAFLASGKINGEERFLLDSQDIMGARNDELGGNFAYRYREFMEWASHLSGQFGSREALASMRYFGDAHPTLAAVAHTLNYEVGEFERKTGLEMQNAQVEFGSSKEYAEAEGVLDKALVIGKRIAPVAKIALGLALMATGNWWAYATGAGLFATDAYESAKNGDYITAGFIVACTAAPIFGRMKVLGGTMGGAAGSAVAKIGEEGLLAAKFSGTMFQLQIAQGTMFTLGSIREYGISPDKAVALLNNGMMFMLPSITQKFAQGKIREAQKMLQTELERSGVDAFAADRIALRYAEGFASEGREGRTRDLAGVDLAELKSRGGLEGRTDCIEELGMRARDGNADAFAAMVDLLQSKNGTAVSKTLSELGTCFKERPGIYEKYEKNEKTPYPALFSSLEGLAASGNRKALSLLVDFLSNSEMGEVASACLMMTTQRNPSVWDSEFVSRVRRVREDGGQYVSSLLYEIVEARPDLADASQAEQAAKRFRLIELERRINAGERQALVELENLEADGLVGAFPMLVRLLDTPDMRVIRASLAQMDRIAQMDEGGENYVLVELGKFEHIRVGGRGGFAVRGPELGEMGARVFLSEKDGWARGWFGFALYEMAGSDSPAAGSARGMLIDALSEKSLAPVAEKYLAGLFKSHPEMINAGMISLVQKSAGRSEYDASMLLGRMAVLRPSLFGEPVLILENSDLGIAVFETGVATPDLARRCQQQADGKTVVLFDRLSTSGEREAAGVKPSAIMKAMQTIIESPDFTQEQKRNFRETAILVSRSGNVRGITGVDCAGFYSPDERLALLNIDRGGYLTALHEMVHARNGETTLVKFIEEGIAESTAARLAMQKPADYKLQVVHIRYLEKLLGLTPLELHGLDMARLKEKLAEHGFPVEELGNQPEWISKGEVERISRMFPKWRSNTTEPEIRESGNVETLHYILNAARNDHAFAEHFGSVLAESAPWLEGNAKPLGMFFASQIQDAAMRGNLEAIAKALPVLIFGLAALQIEQKEEVVGKPEMQ